MQTWISHRATLAALAAAGLLTGLGLWLAVASSADTQVLSLSATGAGVGQTIDATATLAGAPDAEGEISFEVFGPGDPSCVGPALSPAPAAATVSGEGEYTSGSFTTDEAGTYHWSAHYTGDGTNPAADAECAAASVVAKATPSLAGNASDNNINAAIHDEVTVSGGFSPGGEIVFKVFAPGDSSCATALATSSDTLSGGQASSQNYTPQHAGEFHWTAEYKGDGNNEAVLLGCGATNQASTVAKASPSLSGSASSGPVGSTIGDEVTLSGGFNPGGELRFRAYGPGDTTCSGSTQYDTTVAVSGNGSYEPAGFAPGAGTYRWKVDYTGDGDNKTASLGCGAPNQTSVVGVASPSLSGSAGSGAAGSTIGDSVTLSGGFSPGGELRFRAYGAGDNSCSGSVKYEASVAVSGNGAYSPPGFTTGVGTYRWEAEYTGDANNDPAELACGAPNQTSTVTEASPSLAGTAGSGPVGSTISDSVAFTGGYNAGGELRFRAFAPGDTACSGAALYDVTLTVSGNKTYAPAGFAPGAGSYRWTVEYTGDTNNQAAGLACGSANQESVVSRAAPGLTGTATSAQVGAAITDNVTLAGGFKAGGELTFRTYGPGDSSCSGAVKYEAKVPVSGNGTYAPPGFQKAEPGLYHWRVDYSGDANNNGASIGCDDPSQASAVGVIDVKLGATANGATVGNPIAATATLREGAIPGGQITFAAYPPSDANCSGTPSFTKPVPVVGNGTYGSGAFVPARVGTFRWVVSYSGDANHAATAVGCGGASSEIAQARPSLASSVPGELSVGTAFQITATLQGGFAPSGTVTFRIYGPNATSCGKALSTNTVSVSANGTVSSAPFVALNPGRYLFVASYSGNANNAAVAESCDPSGRVAVVAKRLPKVKPSARLKGRKRISIRARLLGATSPSGTIRFRLYKPGNKTCQGKPAFSGGVTVKANGRYLLAQYLAKKPGIYRLAVSYSGDKRNQRFDSGCTGAQQIRVG